MSHAKTHRGLATNLPPYRHWVVWAILLALALVLLSIIATSMGFINISFGDVVRIVLARILNQPQWISTIDPLFPTVVMDVRLPPLGLRLRCC